MRYPIIEQRNLDVVGRRALRRRVRPLDELPKPNAHEVLVFRVNGRLIADNEHRSIDQGTVADASHASLVDMSLNMPVIVELAIRAADATTFTVQVTFECTVTDPVAVVRNGRTDARNFLEGYLRSEHRIFDLGQKYRFDEVANFRQELIAGVTAFVTGNPATEPGMRIQLAGIEVIPSAELAEFERRRRELLQWSVLEVEKSSLFHTVTRTLEDQKQELEELRQRHDHKLRAEVGTFQLDEVQKHFDRMGHSSQLGAYLALVTGGISPVEFAQQLRTQAERYEQRRDNATRHALREHLDALKVWIRQGGTDNVNVDPDKLDALFNRLIDDVTTAIDSLPPKKRMESIESGPMTKEHDDAD
ncbi:hypothetical protein ACWEO2_42375 [Nocardia sp. NPDC004278]